MMTPAEPRLWPKLTNDELFDLINEARDGDPAARKSLVAIVHELTRDRAKDSKFRMHEGLNILIEPADLSSQAVEKTLPYLTGFEIRSRSDTRRTFKAWLIRVISSCYFDMLREVLRSRTPADWKSRTAEELDDEWLCETVIEIVSRPWHETVGNKPLIVKDYTGLVKGPGNQVLSMGELVDVLCVKIKRDALAHTPAVFLTGNYQSKQRKGKNSLLRLDDVFSHVDPSFVALVNNAIMPVVKSRITARVLVQKESLIERRSTKVLDTEEEVERQIEDETSVIPIGAPATAEDLISTIVKEFEPHRVIVFIMTQAIGWGVDDLIRRYSLYSLRDLYDSFLEHARLAFPWDVERALLPLREQLECAEKDRKFLNTEEIMELRALPPEDDRDLVNLFAIHGREGFDTRVLGDKLLGEFLVRTEKNAFEAKSSTFDKARNRVQNWIRAVRRWARERYPRP